MSGYPPRVVPRCSTVAVLVLVLAACASAPRYHRTPGCVVPERSTDVVRLARGASATLAPACPDRLEGYIRGPITLTASDEGLRVQFHVVVATFSPGPYRDERGDPERDAVVVFPSGEGSGRAAIELSTIPAPGGYEVDDVIPWEVWGLQGPSGTFHLVIAVFDRQSTGAEHETRISTFVIVGQE